MTGFRYKIKNSNGVFPKKKNSEHFNFFSPLIINCLKIAHIWDLQIIFIFQPFMAKTTFVKIIWNKVWLRYALKNQNLEFLKIFLKAETDKKLRCKKELCILPTHGTGTYNYRYIFGTMEQEPIITGIYLELWNRDL